MPDPVLKARNSDAMGSTFEGISMAADIPKKCIHPLKQLATTTFLRVGTVWICIKIVSIPDEEKYSKTAVGAPLHILSKLYDVPVEFINPPTDFEAAYSFYCSRRKLAAAPYGMICLESMKAAGRHLTTPTLNRLTFAIEDITVP